MTLINSELGTPEKFNVILEIPKDSPIKYEYDEATDTIISDFIFKDGFVFRYNYGFIPRTLADDHDPLDVFILIDEPLEQGKTYQALPIGMIDLLDRGEPDNKILAVLAGVPSQYADISDFSPQQLQEFRDFFAGIAEQKNKEIIIKEFQGREQAIAEVRRCAENYKSS